MENTWIFDFDFIVAIKSIESEIIDAAMLDGVTPLQCFWYIKLPIIKSSLLICGILTIYNSFRCFREAYLIGGSHPNEQLYSIQHFLQNNFMNMNYARLEAASILVVIFVGAFVLSGMCLARKRGTSDEITKRNHIRHPAPDSCGAFCVAMHISCFPDI